MYTVSDKEAAIRAVQRFLLELHYEKKQLPHITIDGIYGPDTERAVRSFQALSSLPITGAVDDVTWRALYRDYRHALDERTAKKRLPGTPFPLSAGSHGEGVKRVQHLMNALAERYGLGIRTDETGVYSYATAALANAVRRIYRLPEDGCVTGELYEKMERDLGYPTK